MSNTLFINNTKMHLITFSLYLKVVLVLFLASKKKQEANNIGETEPVVCNAGKSSKLEEQNRMRRNGKGGKKEV